MFLLSGEMIVSYRGHFGSKSSKCNPTELPHPLHNFQRLIVNFHTRNIPSAFFLVPDTLGASQHATGNQYMLQFHSRHLKLQC